MLSGTAAVRCGQATGGTTREAFRPRRHARLALYHSFSAELTSLCSAIKITRTLFFVLQRGDKICGNPCPICRDPNIIVHHQVGEGLTAHLIKMSCFLSVRPSLSPSIPHLCQKWVRRGFLELHQLVNTEHLCESKST